MANTCKGIRCKKTKVQPSAYFCKVHTTNEICETCGSDMISSTDSILKSCGKSLCVGCKREEGARAVERMHIYLEELRVKNEEKRRVRNAEYDEFMRKHKEQMEALLRGTNSLSLNHTGGSSCMQAIVEEIF